MKVTLLVAGGGDSYYELGLLSGLITKRIDIEFIGSNHEKDSPLFSKENVTFYNFRGYQNPNVAIKEKILRILGFYFKLIKYAYKTDSNLFHIQWLPKFAYFDRTFLIAYFKLLGKKLVFTAHNINSEERDENDSAMNRLTLRFLYKIVDGIIVHTQKMKSQLVDGYNSKESKVTVIPHGINSIVKNSELTREEAKKKLDLQENDKVILFFGRIKPYKGLDNLLSALVKVKQEYNNFKLIIAGKIYDEYAAYWKYIQRIIEKYNLKDYIVTKTEYIPDEEVEVYFKSADVLLLPYKYIFQSGLIFLSYAFGLPIIATDVGSLREEIVEGITGFICQPEDPNDLSKKIVQYFRSYLCENLGENRKKIIEYAHEKYSWEKIGEKTYFLYEKLL